MVASLHRLRTKADRIDASRAAALRQLVLEFPGLPERARGEIIAAIDQRTPSTNEWPFLMLSPEQNDAVVAWLLENSKRPQKAVRLWSFLFRHLRRDTGEVVLGRAELAEKLDLEPRTITELTAELEGIGAISRRREPRNGPVRYFMNPNVATHLAGKAREHAQGKASPLELAPLKLKRRPKLAPVD
jgi:DNA-binding transcriptional ArsR family regulator